MIGIGRWSMRVVVVVACTAAVAVAQEILADRSVLWVDVVQNGDFELVADSTTLPVKRGAYWRDAFVPRPGVADDRVVEWADGQHALRLAAGEEAVSQVVTLLGPHRNRFELHLSIRGEEPDSRLRVTVEPFGEPLSYDLAAARGADEPFQRVVLTLGRDLAANGASGPWCRVALSAEQGVVLVDDVVGAHALPRVDATTLREVLVSELRDQVRVFAAPRERAARGESGLGLIDPQTGYLLADRYDVVSGEITARQTVHGIAAAHGLMLSWLKTAPADDDPLRGLVELLLRRHLKSLLRYNVYPSTGLFCLWDSARSRPFMRASLSPSHFIGHVMDVAERIDAPPLQEAARRACVNMADTLVALQQAHDLPKADPFGRGVGGNWFGRLPDRLLPTGELDWPKKQTYDQVWAIENGLSWYHDFDALIGLMRVWRDHPNDRYLAAARRALELYDRKPDATRYDLENDTDDYYGKAVEALLLADRSAAHGVPELRVMALSMTDYRLPRDAPWHQNVWVEGIRLGSFTTGDQPRAFRGPVGLFRLPPAVEPGIAGYDGYRRAVHELTRADLKRRLLCDGSLNDASSYQWEMMAACFLGDYIGPCSQGFDWEGDVGDLFCGPSSNAFRALARAVEVSEPGRGHVWLAWYAALHAHTVARYRRAYGYEVGMDPAIGRRYGIPDRYLTGFSTDDPLGLAPVMVHADLLESASLDRPTVELMGLSATIVDGAVRVIVEGPPGGHVTVRRGPSRYRELSADDPRLTFVDPGAPSTSRCDLVLDEEGRAEVDIDGTGGAVEAMLRGATEDEVTDLLSVRLPVSDQDRR